MCSKIIYLKYRYFTNSSLKGRDKIEGSNHPFVGAKGNFSKKSLTAFTIAFSIFIIKSINNTIINNPILHTVIYYYVIILVYTKNVYFIKVIFLKDFLLPNSNIKLTFLWNSCETLCFFIFLPLLILHTVSGNRCIRFDRFWYQVKNT